ncbi:LL-diaminopimelate aminotransferase [Methanonatronarchaeum sp. AMET6-2]|uniref:LL-diaminopimelate aminotransferase n=1 Tax=Methanonatronarchaeum sp. AMET6-2 TaxID=2933293 RepID=UPI001213C52C|nr:LL-diaminopimelate aminotransferase [Methanonatronarchaeum sp. AMET6-2]RZN60535.1 MAG: LL-diaminopimelate aminotransferase [Methanonatronarchaeia archaeon]UOY10476.1 LL-diaminopimelate aminotransferase [Methanonatronarchaeum sp. AMET6-2]
MYSNRIESLPPYLFAELDRAKKEKEEQGIDIIDLGVGDPDLSTPDHIVDSMVEAVRDPSTHSYPSYKGMEKFRETVSNWYQNRFGIEIDPETEALSLIGSKEGIAHMPLAFVDPGDKTLVPDPAYPVYKIGTILSGGEPIPMPLKEQNNFLPDLEAIKKEDAEQAEIIYLNYPNNPTAGTANEKFFNEVVEFAREHDIKVCHDAAYTEISYDNYKAPSFLNADGAKEVGVEFHSLSKTYNMTGWRIGFAVGNSEIIKGIGQVKTNVDSGVFQAIQKAAITALTGPQDCVKQSNETYRDRRDLLLEGIKSTGLEATKTKATFYIWTKCPEGYTSMETSKKLLDEAGIVATPGSGFGEHGEGYVRFALTRSLGRIEEAVERMEGINFD